MANYNNYNNGYGQPRTPYQNNQYGNQYPGQQYGGPQYPGQQYPGHQYPGHQYPMNQYPGQPYPGGQYQPVPQSNVNGFGIAGFSLAILAIIFCWTPGFNFICWFLGLVFSIVGLCVKKSKALAIAGLIISLVNLIILVLIFGFFTLLLAGAAANSVY